MKKAFTLVELAIVLVIIGLLVGGVVGGQSLVESSKRQKMVTQYKGMITAYRAFKLEYNGIPGDLKDAESYWPTKTTNGNNDKIIDCATNGECSEVFKQLSFAELIPGNFVNSGSWQFAQNAEAPEGPYPNSGFLFTGQNYTTLMFGTPRMGNLIRYGGEDASGNGYWAGAINQKTSKAFDQKIDDGIGSSGLIIGSEASGSNTADCLAIDGSYNLANGATDYNVTKNTNACRLFIFYE